MEDQVVSALYKKLGQLERRLRFFQALAALGVLVLAAISWAATRPASIQANNSSAILRVRGIVIEDERQRERILLGAPIPKLAGRKRQDDLTGLVLVGENGADRVAIASPMPEPQVRGKVGRRTGKGAGITVCDPDGNERGGFAAFDDGGVLLGLDYPEYDAIQLAVQPDGAFLRIADTAGKARAFLFQRGQSAPKWVAINLKDKSNAEVVIFRLNPFTTKKLVVRGRDKALLNALDSMKP